MAAEIKEQLDLISGCLFELKLDEPQVAVRYTLQATITYLQEQASDQLPSAASRLSKFFEILYGSQETYGTAHLPRWQRLRDLDCELLLFVAVSYTPLDLIKMRQVEFDCLLDFATKYLNENHLPPRWIFRKEIQTAIALKLDLPNLSQFKKRYHSLEFTSDNSDNERPGKRQSQGVSISARDANTSIIKGIKDSTIPRERQNSTPGKERDNFTEAEHTSPYTANREVKSMFTNALVSTISLLPEPFKTAVENSKLWRWERLRGEKTTGCLATLFSKDETQDVSFTIWCGHDEGYHLNDIFGVQRAISS
ncbi:hypothetical protein TESG_05388 [Trichophyton tonsurans CBS 112818]|uniref:Uncharacterized protein n=1 Tax=Trichophyton tonsurans (strain CBS 112818) TaxID=647933 RepID=F2S2T6_TRIT1|nr:hypothetical protein TESG_05388 [Trichophyton tonsurans CBS 112818]